MNILVGAFLAEFIMLKKHKFFNFLISIILLFTLTITGITEWNVYIRSNSNPGYISTDSPFVKWVKEKTDKDDIFLTPMWSMHNFFLTGRASYYGWPYYAWSAGHDTNKRCDEINLLLSGMNNSVNDFINYCKKHHIKYWMLQSYRYINIINKY